MRWCVYQKWKLYLKGAQVVADSVWIGEAGAGAAGVLVTSPQVFFRAFLWWVRLGFLTAWLLWGSGPLAEGFRALAGVFQLTRESWPYLRNHPASSCFFPGPLCLSQPGSRSGLKGELQVPRGAFGMGQNNLPQPTDSRLQKQTYFRRQATSDGMKLWPLASVVGN